MKNPTSALLCVLCSALSSFLCTLTLALSVPAWADTEPEQTRRDLEVDPDVEQASALAAGAELSLRSRYLWRGLPFSDGPVLQPSGWVSLWDCSATAWANLALPAPQQDTDLDEVDLGAGCIVDAGILSAQLGSWVYLYPGEEAPASVEGEGAVTAQWGAFSVSTGHAVDLAAVPGAYAGWVGVGGEWERWAYGLEASARTGWANASFNEANAGVATGALDYAGAEVAVSVPLGAGVTLRPHAGGVVLLPERLTDALDQTVVLDFGVTVGGEWRP